MNSIQPINNYRNLNFLGKFKKYSRKLDMKNDFYYLEDKSSNNKFDLSECAKNFAKGILSPISAVIKHPVASLIALGTVSLACSLVPVLGPITAVGFGALSVYQFAKGTVEAISNYKKGDYDESEKSFNKIGQGTIGTVLSILGMKQSAKIAKEAKLMDELNVTSLTKAQKDAIALEVKNGKTTDAIKETISLFTTKKGLKATFKEFRFSNIRQRGKDLFNFLFKREDGIKIKKEKVKFNETKEGQRRAAMSTEEIEREVQTLADQAFEEYGIPKELRPQIKVIKGKATNGGGYNSSEHTITINETAYKEGIFDLPNVIKHESTHAKEAILRQRLPMEEKEKVAIQYFLDKIQNGEKETIITGEGNIFSGNETMKPPKFNAQMKTDFSKFATDYLYQTSKKYTNEELIQMIRPMVESNPDFVNAYSSTDEAINVLAKYAQSHNARFNIALKHSAGFDTTKINPDLLKGLSAQEKEYALKSFVDGIDCIESNAANCEGIIGSGKDFNQYQFCNEEVLAQQKGNNFEIAKLEQQLKKLKEAQNYDAGEEARLLDLIKQAKLTIEYKTKGADYYRLYTESINNPSNSELKMQVAEMKQELDAILNQINDISAAYSDNMFGTSIYVKTNNYIAKKIKVPPQIGASIYVPYSTTNTTGIIKD